MKTSQVPFLLLALVSLSACTATVNVQEDVAPSSSHIEESTSPEQAQENTTTAPTTQDGPSSVDSAPDFLTTFKTYREHPIKEEDMLTVIEDGKAAPLTVVTEVQVNNCPPNPDGPCGYTLQILAGSNWDTDHSQFYYIGTTGGAGMSYYGSFLGNLTEIKAELDKISELTEL